MVEQLHILPKFAVQFRRVPHLAIGKIMFQVGKMLFAHLPNFVCVRGGFLLQNLQ